MEINKNNLFARYYNWMYRELPNDLCSFFWGTLLAIILAVIMIPGRLFTDRYDSSSDKFAYGFIFWLFVMLITISGTVFYSKQWLNSLEWYYSLPLALITGVAAWSVFLGSCWLFGTYMEKKEKAKWQNYNPNKQSTWSKINNFIGATRGKYCTIIKWK